MEEFIISALNFLGLGVNALVMFDGSTFIEKINEYVPDVELKLCQSDKNGMTICVGTPKGDGFKIKYTFAYGTRRVCSIKIEK